MWLLMIVVHASAATGAFLVGALAIRPERARRHPWAPAALSALIGLMLITMLAAMASHWGELPPGARWAFGALAVLGSYLVHRSARAVRGWRAGLVGGDGYVDDIGFVLISLWNGFVIVAAIDLGAPVWLVVVLALVAVGVGHRSIQATKAALGAGISVEGS